MKYRYVGLLVLLVAVLSAIITRYYFPQVQEKQVIQEKEVIKKDIRTIIKEVKRPDGTVETVTETIDRTKETKKREEESIKFMRKDWYISAGVGTEAFNLQEKVYSISVNRRILGPAYLGFTATTNKTYLLSVGMEF